VKFETPAALWALATLALLVLFSLWRQAAARVTVPSLLLWKKIPERNPPVRALRRPRWRLELLLQALAIAAAVAALAGPYRETEGLKPRRVAFVFDTSARMRAGGRLERAKAQAARLAEEKLQADEVTCYAASPSPRSFKRVSEAGPVDIHVDPEPLLAAARPTSDHVVLFSDRPQAGAALSLLAAPADNVGIVEFTATNDEVFVRLVNHGPARPIPVDLIAGSLRVHDTVPAGELKWVRRGDYSKAESIRVSLDVADSFPLDNVVEAARLGDLATTVSLAGLIHPQLVKALRSIPGVTLRMGEGNAKVAVGVDAAPGPGDLRIWIISATGRPEGEVRVAKHPLMADLDKRASELKSVLGELPPGDRAGEPLIWVGGTPAAALKGGDLRIAIDVNEWGKGLASLPIFWANVVDVARSGASGFVILRTGRPLLLPPGSSLQTAPQGAVVALSPEGWLVAHTVGEYGLETAWGPRTLRANLLDERESDTAGESRSLGWDPASPSGREAKRHGYAGAAAGAALALLLLAWIMQLRSE
jgi:hypothetical protein